MATIISRFSCRRFDNDLPEEFVEFGKTAHGLLYVRYSYYGMGSIRVRFFVDQADAFIRARTCFSDHVHRLLSFVDYSFDCFSAL